MKRYRVVITPFAEDNIRKAHDWLKSENPAYAAQWLAGMCSMAVATIGDRNCMRVSILRPRGSCHVL